MLHIDIGLLSNRCLIVHKQAQPEGGVQLRGSWCQQSASRDVGTFTTRPWRVLSRPEGPNHRPHPHKTIFIFSGLVGDFPFYHYKGVVINKNTLFYKLGQELYFLIRKKGCSMMKGGLKRPMGWSKRWRPMWSSWPSPRPSARPRWRSISTWSPWRMPTTQCASANEASPLSQINSTLYIGMGER